MGMSASQARLLSITARLDDLTFKGQEISNERTRLAMQTQNASKKYTNSLSDRRLYVDSFNDVSGETEKARISVQNLLDQGLYVFDGENIVGFSQSKIKTGERQVLTGYENDLTNPTSYGTKLETITSPDKTQPTDWNKKTEYDKTKPIAWEKMSVTVKTGYEQKLDTSEANIIGYVKVPQQVRTGNQLVLDKSQANIIGYKKIPTTTTVHHPAETTSIKQVTASDCKAATSSDNPTMYANLTSVMQTAGITDPNQAEIVKYNTAVKNASGTYDMKELVSLAIKSESAMNALNASNAFNTTAGLAGNYLLLADMNVGGSNWNPIGNANASFSGIFDGNNHTISNMTIDRTGDGNQMYQGLFGNNSGSVKGVNLSNASITLDSARGQASWTGYVAGIAGLNGASGSVENCNVSGISISIAGDVEEIGGVVGRNFGTVDKCSSTGSISVGGYAGDIGGLIGWHQSGQVTRSFSDMNISIAGTSRYGGNLIGDGGGGNYQNCYALGSFSCGVMTTFCNPKGLAGNLGQGVQNSFYLNQAGEYVLYDNNQNGTSANDWSEFQNAFNDTDGTITINGQSVPVWIFPNNQGEHPTLNNDAVNVVTTQAWNETITTETEDPNQPIYGDKMVEDPNQPLYRTEMVEDPNQPIYGSKTVDDETRPIYRTDIVDDPTKPIDWETKQEYDYNDPIAWATREETREVRDLNNPLTYAQKPVYATEDIFETVYTLADDASTTLSSDELEAGLRNGKYHLAKLKEQLEASNLQTTSKNFQSVSWSTSTVITDSLYTENDALAEAQYESEIKKLQMKDKELELDQKQIDTEYNALSTEHDSVKQVINKNVERSFKTFG